MIRTALGIAAQVAAAVGIACLVPYAGAALADALTSLFVAAHLGF